jgi:hypothetical protein
MRYPRFVAALLTGFTFACAGGDTGQDGQTAEDAEAGFGDDAAQMSAADLPDPCELVTDEEISELLWEGMEAGQREGSRARNAQYEFSRRVENVDFPVGRTCFIQYRLVAGETTWSEGDFQLRTLDREAFDMLAGSNASKDPVPGLGDEAFYMSNAAYARRGAVGVEVVEFHNKELEIELLRDAVARLQ